MPINHSKKNNTVKNKINQNLMQILWLVCGLFLLSTYVSSPQNLQIAR